MLTIEQIKEERNAMALEIDSATSERLAEIEARIGELSELEKTIGNESAEYEKRQQVAKSLLNGEIESRKVEEIDKMEKRDFTKMSVEEILSAPEYRSAFLKNLQGKSLDEAEQRALTTAGGSASAAVPTTTLGMIVDKLRMTSALYSLVTVSFIEGNLSLAVANAKNAAAWKAEGTDGTPADDTLATVSLTGYELIKLVEVSAAARTMAIGAFEAYIVGELSKQMAIAIENAILNGLGSGSNQPTGVLTGVTFNGANSKQYTKLDYDGFVDARALLPSMYRAKGVWVLNSKAEAEIMKIKSADGKPLFTADGGAEFAGRILGRPYIVDDYAVDDVILFGDFSYYYLNFSKSPEIQADSSVGFKSGKTTYRGLAVVDGKPALSEAFVKFYK